MTYAKCSLFNFHCRIVGISRKWKLEISSALFKRLHNCSSQWFWNTLKNIAKFWKFLRKCAISKSFAISSVFFVFHLKMENIGQIQGGCSWFDVWSGFFIHPFSLSCNEIRFIATFFLFTFVDIRDCLFCFLRENKKIWILLEIFRKIVHFYDLRS